MKTLKTMLCVATITCLLSCASDTEKGALDKIAAVYDANVSYSKSFVSNAKESRKTFNVFISDSKMIDTLAPTVTTANSAVLVYNELTEDEKKNYSDIEVFLINSNKDTTSYYYPMSAIAPVSHKGKIFKQFSESIVNKDFKGLDALKNSKDIPQSLDENMEIGMRNFEKKNGKLIGYYPFGISEEKDEIGKIYQFQSYLQFANGHKTNYLIVVDATEGKDQIVGYKFFK